MDQHAFLLTCVQVVARHHKTPVVYQEAWERIEAFVDGPERWLRMKTTSNLSLHCPVEVALDKAMKPAAARGLFHIIQWLHEYFPTRTGRDVKVSRGVMNVAATNGHFNIVHFLQSNRSEGCSVKAMDGAAINGHIAVVKYLFMTRTEGCSSDAFDGAARRGDLKLLKLLHQHYRHVGGVTPAGAKSALFFYNAKLRKWLMKHYRHVVAHTRLPMGCYIG